MIMAIICLAFGLAATATLAWYAHVRIDALLRELDARAESATIGAEAER